MSRISTYVSYSFRLLWYLLNFSFYKKLGVFSYVNNPLKIKGRKNIVIGPRVYVGYKSWIECNPLSKNSQAILEIGHGSSIGNFNHIYCISKIKIGKKVLTTDKVYISDCSHNFSSIYKPIIHQGVKQLNSVEIGDGSWIGESVSIIGSSIGKNSVIGANSVVVNDIPDYCVAVGSPAKIVKKFNLKSNKWVKF